MEQAIKLQLARENDNACILHAHKNNTFHKTCNFADSHIYRRTKIIVTSADVVCHVKNGMLMGRQVVVVGGSGVKKMFAKQLYKILQDNRVIH